MDPRVTLPIILQNSDSTNLTAIGNKVVILDVWYSHCGLCFKKFPEFEALAKEYSKDTNLYFAALNIPMQKELDTLGSFGLIKDYSFNKLQATSTTTENKWGIEMGYPTLLVFDKNHKIRYSGTLNTNRYLLVNNIHKIIEELKKE
ncbi:MAG: TlpA family protein disulfide reductase [Chitinophagaceae bacterium]|nr:TlpA family protein disulfide reductase [Chitinophagaceae bacterium]